MLDRSQNTEVKFSQIVNTIGWFSLPHISRDPQALVFGSMNSIYLKIRKRLVKHFKQPTPLNDNFSSL